ncbi:MAG: rod shape-determining protein RodA [Armatimonadetes bacterium]|nr:rod shape-determining protein RodA [Armatimonadota bacterium]
MVERHLAKNFDYALLFVTGAIITFSCAMIYSASRGGVAGSGFVERQMMWAVLGCVGAAVVASIDHTIYTRHAKKLYVFNVLMLIAVVVAGHESKGAQRWIGVGPFTIQPSEFAKIIMIITLAVFLAERRDRIRGLGVFAGSFIYLAIPMLLIFKQPDLGTSLVLIAIWITMLFVMGTDFKNIVLFCAVGAALGLTAWFVPGLMKDYQKNRVITFVNPDADRRGSGYHVTQSRIAIGSGKMLGKGFLKGTQRELRFIPEQHTDFIFTVVGEETGFVGAAGLLLLYFMLLWRGLTIMWAAEDSTGRAIAAGVVGMLAFHVIVNIGMTVGVMPVTGVPLPMFSYGGSSLMANLMAIGLLEGVSMRRHKISF